MKKIILFILVIFLIKFSYGQGCNASFTYVIDSLSNQVQFTNTSAADTTITYQVWSFNMNTADTSNAQNPSFTYTVPGWHYVCLHIYTATYCQSNNCDSVFITPLPCDTFLVNGSVTNATTQNSSDGSINAIATGGTPPYIYQWSTGATTSNITNLPANTYILWVSDSYGCNDSNVFTVNYDSLISPCNALFNYTFDTLGRTVHFQNISTGPDSVFNYLWIFPSGTPGASQLQHETVSWDTAGTFQVCLTISSPNGCNSTFCDSIIISPCSVTLNTVVVNNTSMPSVNDGSISLTISNAYAPVFVSWSTGATGLSINNLAMGIYIYNIIDSLGCTVSGSISIGSDSIYFCNTYFHANQNPNSATYIFTDSSATSLNVIGYNWTFSGGIPATSAEHFPNVGWTDAGIHTVCLEIMLSDSSTCSNCDSAFYNTPCNFSVSEIIINSTNLINNGSINLTLQGNMAPMYFHWSNGATTEDIQNLLPGTYSVTITDSLYCTKNFSYTVQSITCQAYITFSIDSTTHVVTFNASATPEQTYNYTWILNNAFTSNNQQFEHTFPTSATQLICLSVFGANGCVSDVCDSITVPVFCDLLTSNTSTPVTLINGNDGNIQLTISGGYPPYNILWSTGNTTGNLTNISSGNYHVTVSDQTNCSALISDITLHEPYDTNGGLIVDSLKTNAVDTCLQNPVTSFFIDSIYVNPSLAKITVIWIFIINGNQTKIPLDYNYSTTGNNYVSITIICNKQEVTYSSYIHILQAAEISENNTENNVNFVIFPNPVTDKLYISISEPASMIAIYNITGQRVLCETKSATFIDVSHLTQGAYFIELSLKNNNKLTLRFIK